MAARVEGLAEPGTTYVTEETFRLTKGLFQFQALGKKMVKGQGAPVSVYRVLSGKDINRHVWVLNGYLFGVVRGQKLDSWSFR
jgi:class 3 adenylate cyclase